ITEALTEHKEREEADMNNGNFTRRELLLHSGGVGLAAAVPLSLAAAGLAGAEQPSNEDNPVKSAVALSPLKPPASGSIPVAFVISQGAVVIDFAGPWEVFEGASIPGRQMMDSAFEVYTVAETLEPITASGGMKIVPNYTFQNAPAPKVVVIPAQAPPTQAILSWVRSVTKATDVTMSVCTGAFLLAATGLLS